ncbi:MAG: signal peptidase I [Candidatus Omnitrophica bacterium]|nr:signal peptidase I [Candidatus Omnitrophota bacterium]
MAPLNWARLKPVIREYAETFGAAILLAVVLRTFVIGVYKIPTGSMRPTLMERDRILVNKFIYHFRQPRRGEVVVFRYPEDPKRAFIKRFIASSGESVQIRGGHLYINGQLVETPEIFHRLAYTNHGPYGQADQAITVPEGMFYVLGDNTESSKDSRYWGFVPRKHLLGKALAIFWPIQRSRVIR